MQAKIIRNETQITMVSSIRFRFADFRKHVFTAGKLTRRSWTRIRTSNSCSSAEESAGRQSPHLSSGNCTVGSSWLPCSHPAVPVHSHSLIVRQNCSAAYLALSASVVMQSGGAGTGRGKPCSSGKLSTIALCRVARVDETGALGMHDAGTVAPVLSFRSAREPLHRNHTTC